MKKYVLFSIFIMVLFSCSQETPVEEYISLDINGSITKGSYLPGSNISFYELDDRDLRQTGRDYFSIVDNAYGEYELNIDDIDEDIALAVANGYYWDEVRNQVSDGELDLVGIFEWSSELNINVLSHLESERVKYLIQNDLIDGRRSKRFGKAKKQALNEVLAAFGINQEYNLSEDFSFFSTDNKAKILLAISSVLQADRDTYEIASLLAQLRVDIKEDGTIDNEDLREEIGSRLCILDIEQIAANVYQQLGEAFPNLEEDSLVSGFLDDIKAEFSGYECDPKVNPGPNVISIGLITEAIDENCNELTFFTDLDNDGELDDNETVINKITICDGTDGEDGSDGEDAVSIKVVTSTATDCSNGGTTFTFYLDANNNNQKDEGEVVVTETTICNGEDGSDGQNGEDAEPLGVQITDASTEDCPAGGQQITIFRDSDSDGILDESEEILDTAVICNGEDGIVDSDQDGVPDNVDQCPDTPSNTSVNEEGCAFLFIADNGVTIKASDFSQTGETYQLKGESYLVVDRTTLKSMAEDHENQDLTKVVTSKVSDLSGLFYNEKTFNQDISSWDVSNVTTMYATFTYAESFNQDLNNWDTSSLENLNSTFWYAKAFSQDLNNWDVSKVTTMLSLFDKSGFNGDVSNWDTSSVTNMFAVFAYTPFDGDISQWNTSSVTNMHSMFEEATKFNQSIGQWDVSKVESFRDMFNRAFLFDQDISEWDVTAASDMIRMFQNADDFNQDLSNWCVSQFNEEPENFDLSADLWTKPRPIWGTCPLEDDTDGDGVVDYYDQCPNTPSGETVNDSGCAGNLTNGLVAWYPLNGNANDESGNGNDGTVYGATLISDRNGNSNSAYSFDGVDDEIVNPNKFLALQDDYTISVWFNSNNVAQSNQAIFNSIGHTGIGIGLNHNYNRDRMNLFIGDGINFWDLNGIGGNKTDYQNNTWYNVILVKQNVSYKIYINGVVDIETNVNSSSNYDNLVGFRLSSISPEPGYEEFNGKLDDVGIWNRALTDAEIQALYNETDSDLTN